MKQFHSIVDFHRERKMVEYRRTHTHADTCNKNEKCRQRIWNRVKGKKLFLDIFRSLNLNFQPFCYLHSNISCPAGMLKQQIQFFCFFFSRSLAPIVSSHILAVRVVSCVRCGTRLWYMYKWWRHIFFPSNGLECELWRMLNVTNGICRFSPRVTYPFR